MKRKTNLALDCHTIELLINEAKAMGCLGECFIRELLKSLLESLQKKGADVVPLLRTINDYLRTFHIRELQALETDGKAVSASAAPEATEDKGARVVPEVLRTPEAAALLNKAVAAGWLDERWQPTVSSTKAALLAMRLAGILKIENQWQVFGELWNRNSGTLRTSYNRGMEQKKAGDFLKQLKRVLK